MSKPSRNMEDNMVTKSPDTEDLEKFLKEARKDPSRKAVIEFLESSQQTRIAQSQNSQKTIENKRQIVNPEVIAKFPNSPTAQRHMVAFNFYRQGANTLHSYTKDKVENNLDCDNIQMGFHGYARGYMLEGHMNRQFPLPYIAEKLAEQYLKIRPNDVLVQCFTVVIKICRLSVSDGLPDYESNKEKIRSMEMLAHKILPFQRDETVRRVLIEMYYLLGAHYSITDQDIRALDSFQKCYDLDKTNLSALYGVASRYADVDPDKATLLLHKFLNEAPKCDDKYPNAYYLLGLLSLSTDKENNKKNALKYYKLGLEAEEKWRLPWQGPVDFPAKQSLEMIHKVISSVPSQRKALF